MKFLCVEPITNSGKVCSFVLSGDDYTFQSQCLNDSDDSSLEKYFNNQYLHVCFDALKIMRVFDFKFPYLRDVKVLYQLNGYSFHSLIDLGTQVFNEERMVKYQELSERVKAHLNSYRVAKIDHSRFLESTLLPPDLVDDLYRERAAIILDLYREFIENDENVEVMSFYHAVMYENIQALHTISQEPLLIDLDSISEATSHYAEAVRRNTQDGKAFLRFNAVGAKTGRLSFKKGTINLYSLPRSLRQCVVAPRNYSITQFDFKSFQPRLAVFSTGDEDFKNRFRNIDDIYSIFPGDREKNKIGFLAWMFSQKKNEMFEKEALPIYDMRNKLYFQAKRDGKVVNMFGRVLNWRGEEKNVVFQNYITSIEVDVILSKLVEVSKLLEKTNSRVISSFHDALILSISNEEMFLINKIENIMKSVRYFDTKFPVSILVGNNWSEMKKHEKEMS